MSAWLHCLFRAGREQAASSSSDDDVNSRSIIIGPETAAAAGSTRIPASSAALAGRPALDDRCASAGGESPDTQRHPCCPGGRPQDGCRWNCAVDASSPFHLIPSSLFLGRLIGRGSYGEVLAGVYWCDHYCCISDLPNMYAAIHPLFICSTARDLATVPH